jgi:hypothetical protein
MSRKFRHLTLERLERRELKAGDVAAVLQNGNLFLTEAAGQAGKDNSVVVSQLSNGMVRVEGYFVADGSLSKVNGNAFQDFLVTGSLNVNFGAGNDKVILGGEGVPSMTPTFTAVNIDVSAPQPVNTPVTPPATTTAQATPALAAPPAATPATPDNDNVIIWGVNVAGSMSINTGVGADFVFITTANVGTTGVGNLSIKTGIGSDSVELQNMGFVNGAISVQMNGSQSDVDGVTFNGVFAQGTIQIVTGAGNDHVSVNNTTSFATINIQTGAGNDAVALENVHATDHLMTLLGAGNDSLRVDFAFSNRFDFDGGSGTNSLTISKNLGSTVSDGTFVLNEINWTLINGRLPSAGNA